jgi:methylated-DNA-[protein]-cysteine S-methyltransferase
MKTTVCQSILGPLQLKWKGAALSGLTLPPSPPSEITEWEIREPREDWCDILNLQGIELMNEEAGSFEWAVWHCAKTIPFGETRSYGWIARKIGNPGAARAVGGALGANPWLLLVPCHRVIRTDGTIGGFSSGLEWKRYLLKCENLIFSKKNIRVSKH